MFLLMNGVFLDMKGAYGYFQNTYAIKL